MQRRWSASAVLTVVVVIAVGACDAGEMMADAMVDAGELVRDAGDAMMDASEGVRDSAANDAHAQPGEETVISMEVPCDVLREETYYDDGTSAESDVRAPLERRFRHWYAELRSPAIVAGSIVDMTAVGCGDRPASRSQCPASFAGTCAGDPPFDPLPCRPFPVEADDGVARVLCGSATDFRQETEPGVFSPWSSESAAPVSSVTIRVAVEP